jgi:hypothetical protein
LPSNGVGVSGEGGRTGEEIRAEPRFAGCSEGRLGIV